MTDLIQSMAIVSLAIASITNTFIHHEHLRHQNHHERTAKGRRKDGDDR